MVQTVFAERVGETLRIPAIISHTVWLCVLFTRSYKFVEDLLVEHGPDISYEKARRWFLKFGGNIVPTRSSCGKMLLRPREKCRTGIAVFAR